MIQLINLTAAEQMSEAVFHRTLVAKFNELAAAVNTGVVWDNKVAADCAVDQVYNDLPVTVIAEMIDEEYQSVVALLGLETETQNE